MRGANSEPQVARVLQEERPAWRRAHGNRQPRLQSRSTRGDLSSAHYSTSRPYVNILSIRLVIGGIIEHWVASNHCGNVTVAEFLNPREAAERLRMATASLVDPHDIAVVRQYIYESEAIAREQAAKPTPAEMPDDATADQQVRQIGNKIPSLNPGNVRPLTRKLIHGRLKLSSDTAESHSKWVLKIDEIPPSK